MSHAERKADKVRGQTNAHVRSHTQNDRGIRQREREQMRTRLGYCHFRMIKQLAI